MSIVGTLNEVGTSAVFYDSFEPHGILLSPSGSHLLWCPSRFLLCFFIVFWRHVVTGLAFFSLISLSLPIVWWRITTQMSLVSFPLHYFLLFYSLTFLVFMPYNPTNLEGQWTKGIIARLCYRSSYLWWYTRWIALLFQRKLGFQLCILNGSENKGNSRFQCTIKKSCSSD